MGAKHKAPRKRWTQAEDAIVRARYPHEDTSALAAELGTLRDRLYRRAQILGVRKSAEYLRRTAQHAAVLNGKRSRFKPGQVPHNKGKRHPARGRALETQFKDGSKPSTWVPVWTYLKEEDSGYWKLKVSDYGSAAHGGPNRSHWDWRYVHRLVYEAAYGIVPSNDPIIFLDGNPDNCLDLANLMHVTRAELARLNQSGFSTLPKDPAIRRAAITEAKLRQALHDAGEAAGLSLRERCAVIGKVGGFAKRAG